MAKQHRMALVTAVALFCAALNEGWSSGLPGLALWVSRSGALGEFQQGLAILLAGTGVPVVPCWIEGAYLAWPATRRRPRPAPLRLRIGPAIQSGTGDRADRAAATEAFRAGVLALAPLVREGV